MVTILKTFVKLGGLCVSVVNNNALARDQCGSAVIKIKEHSRLQLEPNTVIIYDLYGRIFL